MWCPGRPQREPALRVARRPQALQSLLLPAVGLESSLESSEETWGQGKAQHDYSSDSWWKSGTQL